MTQPSPTYAERVLFVRIIGWLLSRELDGVGEETLDGRGLLESSWSHR